MSSQEVAWCAEGFHLRGVASDPLWARLETCLTQRVSQPKAGLPPSSLTPSELTACVRGFSWARRRGPPLRLVLLRAVSEAAYELSLEQVCACLAGLSPVDPAEGGLVRELMLRVDWDAALLSPSQASLGRRGVPIGELAFVFVARGRRVPLLS